MDYEPYTNLANAIIVSAVNDYKDAIRLLRRKYGHEMPLAEIRAVIAADLEERCLLVEAENEQIRLDNERLNQKKKLKTVVFTRYDKACSTLDEVDRFIGSRWYCLLTDLDPTVISAHLQQVGG